MAQRPYTIVTCDFDHEEETEGTNSYVLTINNKTYSVDLCPEHYEEVGVALDKIVSNGTKVGTVSRARSSGSRRASRGADLNAAIREWAAAQGYEVASRGRIPQELVEAFEASQKPKRGRKSA